MDNLISYKKHLDQHGFLVVKNYFSLDESKFIISTANKMEMLPEKKGKWMFFFEKNENNKRFKSRLENFINYDDLLKSFLKTRIQPFLEQLVEDELSLFKDKLNWKVANGSGFKAHQDHEAWSDFEPDRYFTAAFSANNSTKSNGCLQFVRNCKTDEIFPYDDEGKLKNEENFDWEFVETTPRDLVIFDSFVPHRSFKNMTENSRRIFYFTYHSSKYGNLYSDYVLKKRLAFPPDIERSLDKTYNIKNNKYNFANPIQ